MTVTEFYDSFRLLGMLLGGMLLLPVTLFVWNVLDHMLTRIRGAHNDNT